VLLDVAARAGRELAGVVLAPADDLGDLVVAVVEHAAQQQHRAPLGGQAFEQQEEDERGESAISIPAASRRRASTNPVGPASWVARTGPGTVAANAATSSLRPGRRRTQNSPGSRPSTAATTPLTWTSKATRV
jgi:hypothetical protein